MNIAMEQTEARVCGSVGLLGRERDLRARVFDPLFLSLLSPPQEYVNGQLKNKYGDAFIRGNNVLYISTDKAAGA